MGVGCRKPDRSKDRFCHTPAIAKLPNITPQATDVPVEGRKAQRQP